ncbi:hypothetical protein P9112_002477 [Eukaryota sp. TZLM1-RC]
MFIYLLFVLCFSVSSLGNPCCNERVSSIFDASWIIDVQHFSSTNSAVSSSRWLNFNSSFSGDCKFVGSLSPINSSEHEAVIQLLTSCPDSVEVAINFVDSNYSDVHFILPFKPFGGMYKGIAHQEGFTTDVFILGNTKIVITYVSDSGDVVSLLLDRVVPPMFPYSWPRMILPWVGLILIFVLVHVVLLRIQRRSAVVEP